MKSKTIAAIAIAAAVIIFAFVQLSRSKAEKPFNLAGDWTIDSVYTARADSQKLDDITIGLMSYAKDKWTFTFGKDSIVRFRSADDSSTAKYYVQDSTLFIADGKDFITHTILSISDHQLLYMAKDSMVTVLKRK